MEFQAILNADGVRSVKSGETLYEVDIYDEEGDRVETFQFWTTPASLEESLEDGLRDSGYVQLDSSDWTDAPLVSVPVEYE